MEPKTPQESEIYGQMLAMLADQFYHQTGNNITINRMELAEMLTKQTIHGIELGKTNMEQILCRLCGKIIWQNAVANEDQDCFYHEACNAELEADVLSKQN